MVGGVCGGIGEYLDIDPTIIRLLFVVVTVLSGLLPGILIYTMALIIMPREKNQGGTGNRSLQTTVIKVRGANTRT